MDGRRPRRRFFVVGFGLLAVLDTTAHVAFKLAANATGAWVFEAAWVLRALQQPWLYLAIGCYVATFFVWMSLLRHAPVGPAFAASHLEVVGVLAVGPLLFGETITGVQALGAALVLGGIGLLALGEARTPQPAAPRGDASAAREP